MSFRRLLPLLFLAMTGLVRADGPTDHMVDQVRPIPPKGIVLSDGDRSALRAGVDELGKEIDTLRDALKRKPDLLRLLPDVQIYHNAVRYAVTYEEFFRPREISVAKKLLEQGLERARQLREGHAPWNASTGLVVRGYVSKIDGSVQPYGLVVPASYRPDTPHSFRLDVWCHGRGENLSELNFIDGRQTSPGEFTPRNAFVLHPYGRYCNANKFAGEIDLFEALENIKTHYPDRRRSPRDARLLDGRRGLLAVRCSLSQCLGRRRARRGLLRDRRLPQGLPAGKGPADLVPAEALASLRLHRLRDQPLQLPDRRLQW